MQLGLVDTNSKTLIALDGISFEAFRAWYASINNVTEDEATEHFKTQEIELELEAQGKRFTRRGRLLFQEPAKELAETA